MIHKMVVMFFVMVSCVYGEQRVAIIGGLWPLASVVAFWTDAKIVYMPKASFNAMENSLASKYRQEYKQAKVGNSENLEELIAINADIYICGVANIKLCSALRKAGLNVVELTTNVDNYNSKKTLEHWLVSLEKYFSIQQNNKKLLDEITQVENFIASRVGEHKIKAIIIRQIDKGSILSGVFSHYLITKSGAENPLGEILGNKINIEEIYKSDPDVIYISNFTPLMPEDLLQNKEWKNMKAVKEGRVYKLPLATYRPFAPSLDLAPTLMFMAQKNYPSAFEDINIEEIYKKHFMQYFGISLDDNDLHKILNPSPNAGILN